MISDLETAVKNYLAAELTADATLSGVTYEVRQATDSDPAAKDRISVVVRVQSAERRITILSDCMVDIMLAVPINVAGVTVSDMKKLEAAIEKAFNTNVNTDATETLNAAIEAVLLGWSGGGFSPEGWQGGNADTDFIPAFRVKVGAVRD